MKLTRVYEISAKTGERTWVLYNSEQKCGKLNLPAFFAKLSIKFVKKLSFHTKLSIIVNNVVLETKSFDKICENEYKLKNFVNTPYPYYTHPTFKIVYTGEQPISHVLTFTSFTEAMLVPTLISMKRPYHHINHADYKFIQFGDSPTFTNELKILDPVRPMPLKKTDVVLVCYDLDKIIESVHFAYLRYNLLMPIVGATRMKLFTSGKVDVDKTSGFYLVGNHEEMSALFHKMHFMYPEYTFKLLAGDDPIINDIEYRSIDLMAIAVRILKKISSNQTQRFQ
jgi:hypothetical protein